MQEDVPAQGLCRVITPVLVATEVARWRPPAEFSNRHAIAELQAVVVSYLEQFEESVDKAVSSQAEAVGAIDSFLSGEREEHMQRAGRVVTGISRRGISAVPRA